MRILHTAAIISRSADSTQWKGNQKSNCLLMQRTANIINSCFCVLTIIPFRASCSAKNNTLHLPFSNAIRKCLAFVQQVSLGCPAKQKGGVCETSCFYSCCQCAEQEGGGSPSLSLSLCCGLKGYSWTTVVG